MIGGSVASSLHGIPRQTTDLDLIIVLPEPAIEPFIAAAALEFYVSERAVREAVKRKLAFDLIHASTGFKVDVHVSGESEFDRAQLERAADAALPGLEGHRIRVAGPEDVILRKLDVFRSGRKFADLQWYDLTGVMKVQGPRLEDDYLDRWAARLGLADLLARARRESGRPS